MRKDKFKFVFTPYILIFFSFFVTVIFLELFFLKPFLNFIPFNAQWYIDEGIRSLAQYSKKDLNPENYIALVGDSYAQGQGDWFRSINRSKEPFHSAHVIHQRTGVDVISFGSGGVGSLRGIAGNPISQFEYINNSILLDLAPPKAFLIYFYEGNDLNNNIRDIRLRYQGVFDDGKIFDTAYFGNFIRESVVENHPVFEKIQDDWLSHNFFLSKFAFRVVRKLVKQLKTGFTAKNINPVPPGKVNKVWLNGSVKSIPDGLQSPALELSEQEIQLGVYVFEQSLAYLNEHFPSSQIGIVYIPSPLSSYACASKTVLIQSYENRSRTYDCRQVHRRSDEIYLKVAKVASSTHSLIIDSRPFIWDRSRHTLVHGPLDWKHFNRVGYTALAEAAIDVIGQFPRN